MPYGVFGWYLGKVEYLELVSNQARLDRRLSQIARLILNSEHDMALDISALTAQVAADTSAVNSAVTLIQSLAAQIAALKSQTTDPETAAKIDALVAQLKANDDSLATAVAANTPAA